MPDTLAHSCPLEFHVLTSDRWSDFESLFGPRGATGGCWCMWWRQSAAEFEANKGERNRRAMRALVDSGCVPGILAYHEGRAVGWCALAPRADYPRLRRSRIAAPVDDQPVWSVVCFFITPSHRRSGIASGLLSAAIDHVRSRGGTILEGYPSDPAAGNTADVFAYQGTVALFRRAGFTEVARRSPTRAIMRFIIPPQTSD